MSAKKRVQLVTLSMGALVALAAFLYTQGQFKADTDSILDAEEKNSLYIEEDPAKENHAGRLEYEYEMLADPATGKVPDNIRKRELNFANRMFIPDAIAPGAAPKGLGQDETNGVEGSENNTFVSYGPFNLGGRTRALAIDVEDENILLAGGVSGGIWRSTDAGQSWTKTLSALEFPPVTTLVQDRRTGHTSDWYFAGGEFFGNSAAEPQAFYYGDGIYRSTDGGQSWAPIAATEVGNNITVGPFSVVGELAIDTSNNGTGTEIYVAGISRIIRTTSPDFSDATTVLGADNSGINVADVLVSSTGRVFASIANSDSNGGASAEEGIWTSPDGINWAEITPPGIPSAYDRIELALDPNDESQLYAIGGQTVGSTANDFLFRYDVDTDTWTELTANLGSSSDVGEGHNMQQGYNLYVKVHPGQSSTVFVGGTNILRSTSSFGNSGSRTQVGGYQPDNNPSSFGSYTNHHPDQHAAVFLPSDPNVMITGSDGGVHRTENNLGTISGPNPVAWSSLNNGYVTTQFYAVDYLRDARGDRRAPGGMQDNGSYVNYTGQLEGDWVRALGGDGSYTAITYNAMYLSAQNGQIRKFDPIAGTNQFDLAADIEPSGDGSEFLFINPFIPNPVNQDQMFIGATGQVYYTDDLRQNPGAGQWDSFTATGMAGERISALAASIQPSGVLYVGTRNGSVYKVADTRNITSATDITDAAMPDGATVSSIAVDPQDADRVVITYANYGVVSIWLSEDGGDTWTDISANLEENANGSGSGPSIRASQFLPDGNGGRMLFVGTSVGLFMTTALDGANTVWAQQSENQIGKNVVSMIKVRPNEGQVMVATHGNGVFVGNYEVQNTPTINYSIITTNEEIILRGPTSSIQGEGFSYQWLRNDEPVDGATSQTLTITNGGTYKLRLTDEIDDSVTESNELIFFLDGTAPSIQTILRLDPVEEETEASEVTFQVTFDEEVQGVDVVDFQTTGDVVGDVMSVTPVQANQVFDVLVNGLGGQGTLGITVVNGNDIRDLAGNAFSGTITTSETYTITDLTSPTVAISRLVPVTEVTNETRLTFSVSFSEAVNNVDASDFELSSASVASASIESVTVGSAASIYSVVVSGATESGLIDLDVVSGTDIADLAGNAFSGTVTTDETYTIDDITSIDDPNAGPSQVAVKQNPTDGVFTVTLSDAYARGFALKVIDGNGKEVLSDQRANYSSGAELTLDISQWPDGLYILNVAGAQRKDVVKLLKQTN